MSYYRSYRSYSCSDGFCGATDCTRCYGPSAGSGDFDDDEEDVEETSTAQYRIARKARPGYGIRPGDLIRVTTGFTYEKGGPRLGYLAPSYCLVSFGPASTAYNVEKFARDCARYLKNRKRPVKTTR